MDVPNSFNSILYATVQPTEEINLQANYTYLLDRPDTHPLLIDAIQRAIVFKQSNPCDPPSAEGCIVFTDDKAPVEWITNNMVMKYVFLGGVEELQ